MFLFIHLVLGSVCVIIFSFTFLCVSGLVTDDFNQEKSIPTGFRRKKMAYWFIDSLEVDKAASAAQ